ncbi:MAG: leucine-rich repeat domain-containing protein [Clostridia bacterium]|nr:leucine-rich repeat domain-containing protein [Clostridia bacterium]
MKITKQFLSVFLALIMIISIIPMSSITVSAAETSGTCGDNLTWSYDESTGTLTISGTGGMYSYYDYETYQYPWEDMKESITILIINNGAINIAESAFSYCENLESVTIPESIISVGSYAFSGCYGLERFVVDDENESYSSDEYGVLFNKDKTGLVKYPIGNTRTEYNIPDTVITIYEEAFDDNFYLTDITIPHSVTSIGYCAFADCFELNDITLPDSVKYIGPWAFSCCHSFVNITIPESVEEIGEAAFASCEKLTAITVDENNQYYSNDEYGVLFSKDKTVLVQYPSGSIRTYYAIPDSVSIIDTQAFSSCNLISVDIPDNVQRIGNRAFQFSARLSEITISDYVNSIGSYAFEGTSFYNNDANWENDVLYIGNHCIVADTDIAGKCAIKDNTITIADDAFNNCFELTEVVIGENVKTIGEWAFGWTKISKLEIPDSVTTISDFAFYNCNALTEVTIADGVVIIGSYAFGACDNITDVYYSGTEAQWNAISIYEGNESLINANIHFLGDETHECSYGWVLTKEPTETEYGEKQLKCKICGDVKEIAEIAPTGVGDPDIPDTDELSFSIQEPSSTTIRHKDGIVLHASCENLPEGSYVRWAVDNDNFTYEESDDGESLTIVSAKNGKTTFYAFVCDADGQVLASDSITMTSKAGFFDKIGSFFRSLFGGTKIYEY